MDSFLGLYALVLRGVQLAFFGVAAVLAVVCLLDWLVRTRRVSPFSAVARWTRRTVDPLIAPVERRVLRAGGTPASAPLWALGAVVIGGVVVLSALQFIGAQLLALNYAARGGARGMLVFAVSAAFALVQVAIMVRVIASWIPSISPYSPWVRWAFTISEPILAPLRRIIPPFGAVDLSPLIAYFAIGWIGGLVVGGLR